MQMIMCDLSANWNNSYRELEQRIISMEQKLDELGQSFQSTSELLSQALQRRHFVHRYRPNPAGHSLSTAMTEIRGPNDYTNWLYNVC